MNTVILPEKNLKDLHDIPKTVRSDLKIIPVSNMDQVVETAMAGQAVVEPPRPRRRDDPRDEVGDYNPDETERKPASDGN